MEKLANGKKQRPSFLVSCRSSCARTTYFIVWPRALGWNCPTCNSLLRLPSEQAQAARASSCGVPPLMLPGAGSTSTRLHDAVQSGQPNGPRGQRSRRAGCHRHPRSGVGGVADASIEEELRCRAQNFAGPSASKNLDLWGLEGNEHLLDLPLSNHPKMVRGV